jgi:hypothetical protein
MDTYGYDRQPTDPYKILKIQKYPKHVEIPKREQGFRVL